MAMGTALLAVMPAGTSAQPAGGAPAPAPKEYTISGLLDLYYQYSFNRPPVGTNLGGRAFDAKHDSFSVAVAEVNIVKNTSDKSPLGFTFTGTVGKNADILHATEPGGANTYKYFQQLFGTYVGSGKTPVTVDFGKFVTWIGYESTESVSNDNYSRSFLWTLGEPNYHVGIRLGAPLSPQLSGNLYLVNGWNEAEDSNGGKTFGATLNFNSGKPVNVILNWLGGQEGSDTANPVGSFGGIGFPGIPVKGRGAAVLGRILDVNLFDLIATWQATGKLKVAMNADYADASRDGVPGGHWSGEAAYVRYQFTPTVAAALRAEHFEDSNGLRTGVATNLNSVTATLEKVIKSNLVLRLEFRHDHAQAPIFPTHNGASSGQDSLLFGSVVKF